MPRKDIQARWKAQIKADEDSRRRKREAIEREAAEAQRLLEEKKAALLARVEAGDKSTVTDGMNQASPMILAHRSILSKSARRIQTQAEFRQLLMASTTDEEMLATRDVLKEIALDPSNRDCIKAIALLWAYVMGKPEQDMRIETRNMTERSVEEKRAMVLALMQKDKIFKDDGFRKQLSEVLRGEIEGQREVELGDSGQAGQDVQETAPPDSE